MTLNIAQKLLVSMLLATGIVVGLMFGLTRYNISNGFADYIAKAELSTLDTLVSKLESRYGRDHNWQFIQDDPQEIWRLIGSAELAHLRRGLPSRPEEPENDFDGPPPGPPPNEMGGPDGLGPGPDLMEPGPPDFRGMHEPRRPPGSGPDMRRLGHPQPRFPEHRMAFFNRLGIFDGAGKLVWGNENATKSQARVLIHSDGKLVGWIKMVPVEKMSAELEQEFIAQQNQSLLVAGFVSFLVAIGAAFMLSRDLVHAIAVLVDGTRNLKSGNFATRIDLARSDELGQLASDFNSLATTLEELNRSQKQWITDTSHELRTPIAILRAQVEALQDGVQQVNPRTLGVLHGEIITLAKLVDDLHDLAKSDLGELRYDFVPVDVGAVLQDAIEAFSERFAAKEITIAGDSIANLHCVLEADGTRLKQLFSNLLENSLRYTNTGGKIKISANSTADALYIYFDDSEPGVPLELASKIFDRFFRTEVSRSRISGGAGLGLSICKSIVEAHKGNITATLSDMGGLRVTVRLPNGEGNK